MLHHLRAAVVAVLRIALPVSLTDFLVFFLDIERVEQVARSKYAEGLLVESIQPFHHAAAVDLAPEIIEAGEQGLAICQAIQGYAVEDHVLLPGAFVRLEGSVAGTEKA